MHRTEAKIIRLHGESIEIRRNGELVAETKALELEKSGPYAVYSETNVQVGDQLTFLKRKKTNSVHRIEPNVIEDELSSLHLFFDSADSDAKGPSYHTHIGYLFSAPGRRVGKSA